MNCEHSQEVHQYHDGELSAGQRDAFEAHLKGCAQCQALLNDLRAMSRMLIAAPLMEASAETMRHLREARYVVPDTGVLKIAGWLTAAAAAILLAALPVWREEYHVQPPLASADTIDPIGVTAPADLEGNRNDVVALAQWMSDDLSGNERH
jgi:anti-sigma factor RsiW